MSEFASPPMCLIVPGLGDSGPEHWQSIWERERTDCRRIELGGWNDPLRNLWITRIDQAVSRASSPVVLVAHSLGCLAVAWWAALLGGSTLGQVRGALLVAPPDPERTGVDPRIARFAPVPAAPLPFPAIVAASRSDPYASFNRSRAMARGWLADLADMGLSGHLNAESHLGSWADGQALLQGLLGGPNPLPRLEEKAAARGGRSKSKRPRVSARPLKNLVDALGLEPRTR